MQGVECDEALPGGALVSRTRPANLSASIRQRLLNLSRERNEVFNLVLMRYALERLLYRLAQSGHANDFVLKGAMLFTVWTEKLHRPTKDLDLLGHGNDSGERLKALFQKICQVKVEPDGLVFDESTVRVEEIRDDQEYQGQRIRLTAHLGNARIPVQIDVAFGDVITPRTEEIDYPTLLNMSHPRVRSYPRETVVSEKLQAMVALGMVNSRMKDFYDIWIISKQFPFDGAILTRAIRATFEQRRTQIPKGIPAALSDEFVTNQEKVTQWRAFLKRTLLADRGVELSLVINELRNFLIPPLRVAASGESFSRLWKEGGPWVHRSSLT